jgi:hypothetical protein
VYIRKNFHHLGDRSVVCKEIKVAEETDRSQGFSVFVQGLSGNTSDEDHFRDMY